MSVRCLKSPSFAPLTNYIADFSPRDSNTISLTSANFPMLGSRPVSAETILPVPPPVRPKLGKEGSKFIERRSFL